VIEFAETDLQKHLKGYSSKLRFPTRIKYLSSIAKGLASIHRNNLIHSDLHTRNILLWVEPFSRDMSERDKEIYENPCVIADLGFCRRSQTNHNDVFGIMPYIAPEVLNRSASNSSAYTFASDIYSFGIIMWEIAIGKNPFAGVEYDANLALAICDGKRPKIPDGIPPEYKELLERCWNEDVSKRPNAEELQKIFTAWLDTNSKTGEFNDVKYNIDEVNEGPKIPCLDSVASLSGHGK
jgi:serine/threonine protein kinase